MPANKAERSPGDSAGSGGGHGDFKHVEMISLSLSLAHNPGEGDLAELSPLCRDAADLGRDPSPGICRKPKLNPCF